MVIAADVAHDHESTGLLWIGAGLERLHKRGLASSSFPGFWWFRVQLSHIFPLMPKMASHHGPLLHSVLWPRL